MQLQASHATIYTLMHIYLAFRRVMERAGPETMHVINRPASFFRPSHGIVQSFYLLSLSFLIYQRLRCLFNPSVCALGCAKVAQGDWDTVREQHPSALALHLGQ